MRLRSSGGGCGIVVGSSRPRALAAGGIVGAAKPQARAIPAAVCPEVWPEPIRGSSPLEAAAKGRPPSIQKASRAPSPPDPAGPAPTRGIGAAILVGKPRTGPWYSSGPSSGGRRANRASRADNLWPESWANLLLKARLRASASCPHPPLGPPSRDGGLESRAPSVLCEPPFPGFPPIIGSPWRLPPPHENQTARDGPNPGSGFPDFWNCSAAPTLPRRLPEDIRTQVLIPRVFLASRVIADCPAAGEVTVTDLGRASLKIALPVPPPFGPRLARIPPYPCMAAQGQSAGNFV